MIWRVAAWLYAPILWVVLLVHFCNVVAFAVSLVMRAEIVPFAFLWVYLFRLSVPILVVGLLTTIFVLRTATTDEAVRRLLIRALLIEVAVATVAMVLLAPVERGSAYFGA